MNLLVDPSGGGSSYKGLKLSRGLTLFFPGGEGAGTPLKCVSSFHPKRRRTESLPCISRLLLKISLMPKQHISGYRTLHATPPCCSISHSSVLIVAYLSEPSTHLITCSFLNPLLQSADETLRSPGFSPGLPLPRGLFLLSLLLRNPPLLGSLLLSLPQICSSKLTNWPTFCRCLPFCVLLPLPEMLF